MDGLVLKNMLEELRPLFEQYASKDNVITEENVHKLENPQIRTILEATVQKLLLEGSKLYPEAHIAEFLTAIKAGKKGIILSEHYSNLDLPIFLYLMEQTGNAGKELAHRSIAMAGMKLTEEDPLIAALTEGYERIVIYPSRTLAAVSILPRCGRWKKYEKKEKLLSYIRPEPATARENRKQNGVSAKSTRISEPPM